MTNTNKILGLQRLKAEHTGMRIKRYWKEQKIKDKEAILNQNYIRMCRNYYLSGRLVNAWGMR